MPPPGFRIKFLGAIETAHTFERGADATRNAKPAMSKVADDLMGTILTQFQSQGRRGGGSWQQLSPKWARYKERKGYDPRIMYMRGRLVNSLTKRRSRNMNLKVTDAEVDLSSRLRYANVQHHGGGPRNLPARPLIHVVKGDEERWAEIVRRHVFKRMYRR